MKKNLFAAILCLIPLCSVFAQVTDSLYPSPEYTNQPYYFSKNMKKLLALEKTSARMEQKTKALGYGGSATEFVIVGEKSSIVIEVSDTSEFVLSATGMFSMMDPSQIFALYALDISGHNREAALQENKGIFGKNKHEESRISYNVKKSGGNLVLVVTKKLSRGQYAFVNLATTGTDQSLDAYCFTVQ